jgi:15-hydroxyprostaglandin dehydrogenase (NAD)
MLVLSDNWYIVAANAGIDDSQDLYVPSDGVTKPNLKTIEVDLLGPLYATYLALHYFRTNEPNTGGKVVITSSTAGLYGCPPQPQYGTAKFGVIGLARSMGENAGLQGENITVNAICPSFVPSGLAPPEMLQRLFSLKWNLRDSHAGEISSLHYTRFYNY